MSRKPADRGRSDRDTVSRSAPRIGRVRPLSVAIGALVVVGITLIALAISRSAGSQSPPPQAPLASSEAGTSSFALTGSTHRPSVSTSTGAGADSSREPSVRAAGPPTLGPPPGSSTDQSPVAATGSSRSENPSRQSGGPSGSVVRVQGPVLARSAPTSIDIPAIGVHSDLLTLGLNADHSVTVPPLNAKDSQAGWYRYSPTPGELGPAIILGHVDSAEFGPAVFFRLGDLVKGDAIRVARTDGSVATFVVDRNVRYPKSSFPTDEVYGNIDHAGLRLITCGGHFDVDAGSYQDNDVVYASLASVT